jgi:hypothetical protein
VRRLGRAGLIESLLRDHTVELRRFVVENLRTTPIALSAMCADVERQPGPVAGRLPAGAAPHAVDRRCRSVAGDAAGALWYLAVENQRQLDTRLATLQSQLQLAQERMQAMNRAPTKPAWLCAATRGCSFRRAVAGSRQRRIRWRIRGADRTRAIR